MTIAFHCEFCNRKIEAPDSAGGKDGKCPGCHKRIHVPGLESDEELKLAPIDEEDLHRQEELIKETQLLTQNILKEKAAPDGPNQPTAAPIPKVSDEMLMRNVITYLRQMADGELDTAQYTAKSITPHGRQAISAIDEIALSDIPDPKLADIPQQVLSKMIKQLRSQIL